MLYPLSVKMLVIVYILNILRWNARYLDDDTVVWNVNPYITFKMRASNNEIPSKNISNIVYLG